MQLLLAALERAATDIEKSLSHPYLWPTGPSRPDRTLCIVVRHSAGKKLIAWLRGLGGLLAALERAATDTAKSLSHPYLWSTGPSRLYRALCIAVRYSGE